MVHGWVVVSAKHVERPPQESLSGVSRAHASANPSTTTRATTSIHRFITGNCYGVVQVSTHDGSGRAATHIAAATTSARTTRTPSSIRFLRRTLLPRLRTAATDDGRHLAPPCPGRDLVGVAARPAPPPEPGQSDPPRMGSHGPAPGGGWWPSTGRHRRCGPRVRRRRPRRPAASGTGRRRCATARRSPCEGGRPLL
jgi:hypothetical protein